jgi:hypothetical protein
VTLHNSFSVLRSDMRVLVCGSRHFNDYDFIKRALTEVILEKGIDIGLIIHGAAKGADTTAGDVARDAGILVQAFPADWDTHGKRAGPIRNYQMLKEGKPDLVVAFIAPNSRGTKHMVEISRKAGIEVKEINIACTSE